MLRLREGENYLVDRNMHVSSRAVQLACTKCTLYLSPVRQMLHYDVFTLFMLSLYYLLQYAMLTFVYLSSYQLWLLCKNRIMVYSFYACCFKVAFH